MSAILLGDTTPSSAALSGLTDASADLSGDSLANDAPPNTIRPHLTMLPTPLRTVDGKKVLLLHLFTKTLSIEESLNCFKKSTALKDYELKSVLVFTDQMDRHPYQRVIDVDHVKMIAHSFSEKGILRYLQSNEMAGIVIGVTDISQLQGDYLDKNLKVLLFHGQHRWKALVEYSAMPNNESQNYWPVRIYSEGSSRFVLLCTIPSITLQIYTLALQKDEATLRINMGGLNEPNITRPRTIYEKYLFYLQYSSMKVENYIESMMSMAPLRKALNVLIKVPGLLMLCTTLFDIAPGFRVNIMPSFFENMAKHRLYTVSALQYISN